jgi:hypothetical protein
VLRVLVPQCAHTSILPAVMTLAVYRGVVAGGAGAPLQRTVPNGRTGFMDINSYP